MISRLPINKVELFNVVSSWAESLPFYPSQLGIREEFKCWAREIVPEDLPDWETHTFELTDTQGFMNNNVVFSLIPRLIAQRLTQQGLTINHQPLDFLYAGMVGRKVRVMSDPLGLYYASKNQPDRDYYSVSIDLSVETVPEHCRPLINFYPKITRFVSSGKLNPYLLSSEKTTVYVRAGSHMLFPMKLDVKGSSVKWDLTRETVFRRHFIGVPLPEASAYLADAGAFVNGSPGDLYPTFRLEMGSGRTRVGSGMPIKDKLDIYTGIKALTEDLLTETAGFRQIKGGPMKYDGKKMIIKQDKRLFREHFAQVIGYRQLTIEIYYEDKSNPLINMIDQQLKLFFGMDQLEFATPELQVRIIHKQVPELLSELPEGKTIDTYEQRIELIQKQTVPCEGVSAALVLLPYQDEAGAPIFSIAARDPKRAIRAGFAKIGRPTQFVSSLYVKNEKDTAEKDSNVYRVDSAIEDLIRQLGYVERISKTKKNVQVDYSVPFTAIHVINSHRTPYGKRPPFMVAVTIDQSTGRTEVICPALWEGKKMYHEALPEFQQVGEKMKKKRDDKQILSDIRKVVTQLYHAQSPHLLLVDSRLTRNIWKAIQDQNLVKEKKNGMYSLQKLWFDSWNHEWDLDMTDPECQLRIIRIRTSDEVPDYMTSPKDNGGFQSRTGLFCYHGVYYGIGPKPFDRPYNNAYGPLSKLDRPNHDYKTQGMIELYPIHLKPDDEPDHWTALANNYRRASYEYTKGDLTYPLPMHMAMQLEEYIY